MAEPLAQAVAAEAQTPAPVATTTAATAEPVATTTAAATTAEPTAPQLHPVEEQEHQIIVDEVSISAWVEGQEAHTMPERDFDVPL
jgi:hypothetical protein